MADEQARLPDLDSTDTRPIHQQIAGHLRDAINTGALPPGGRVPGENQLMARYNVARGTAREALDVLAKNGLIDKVPKVGTFVREQRRLERKPRRYRRRKAEGEFATDTRAAGMDPNIEATTSTVPASAEIARRLDINAGSLVVRTEYRFLADQKPVQLSVSYEPMALVEGTPVEAPEVGPMAGAGVISRMDSIGIVVTHVTEDVTVRPPRAEEIEALSIPVGVHVFEIHRTFSAEGRPVETADIVIPGDRYALSYTFRITEDDDPVTE